MKKFVFLIGVFLFGTIITAGCAGNESDLSSSTSMLSETIEGNPVIAEQVEDYFLLKIVSAEEVYGSEEQVQISASLTYEGEEQSVTIQHAESPFLFQVTNKTENITIPYDMNEPLITTVLESGKPYEEKYEKRAGFSEDDPNKTFFEQFLKGEGFPAGEYEIEVKTDFFIKPDAQWEGPTKRYTMSVSIPIEIVE